MGRPKKQKINAQLIDVDQIIPDDQNFNKGSEEGQQLINKSFKKFGPGRSILIDKNYRNISGNKSIDGFKNNGGKKVLVVDIDANTLVAVRRPDIDLSTKEGREMAMADNQAQSLNYVVDIETVEVVSQELDIDPGEWGINIDPGTGKKKLKEEDIRPFIRTHILLSFPHEKIIELEPHLEAIRKIVGVEYEQGSN